MAGDDKRMHGGNTPGMVPGRGHERAEEPVRLGEREPGGPEPDPAAGNGPGAPGRRNAALGGRTATRSGTAPTPDDEK